MWYICPYRSEMRRLDPSLLYQGLCTRLAFEEITCSFQIRSIWYTYKFLQKYLLDPKDHLLDDALTYLHRNPVCDIVLNLIQNLIKSSLMGKIQDQSVITYILDSLFVFTLATGILRVVPFSNNC
jgi:hypothetical protein